MIDKKKLHFFQLAIIFGLVTLFTLLNQWGYSPPTNTGGEMMGSMGNMMISMHSRGATLADLLTQQEASETVVESSGGHQSHHSGSHLSGIHYITTTTIIVLLPLIIAGAVFLAIAWLK